MYTAMIAGLAAGAAQLGFERAATMNSSVASTVLRQWVVSIGVLMAAIACAKAALRFGPVLVQGPAQSWLLSSPVDRRGLLGGRFAIVLSSGAVAGALLALLAMIAGGGTAPLVPGALAVGAALGCAAASATVAVQANVRIRPVQAALNLALGLCLASIVAVLVLRPATPPAAAQLMTDRGVVAAGVAVFVAAVLTWFAQARLAKLCRAKLSVGANIAQAASVATTFLEPTILWGALLAEHARRVGRVRSAPLRGTRIAALARADFVRVRRTWSGLAVWAGLLPLPYLAEAIVTPVALPAVHVITAFLAADRLAGGLRIISRSPALRRMLGGSDRQLTLAHLVLPATGAVVWCAATAPALPNAALLVCVLSAIGAVLVIYRMATRPPIEYATPTLELGFGTGGVPIWLSIQLSRGPALLLALAWAQTALAG
ncbi:DUF6297 family protein [Amycolatopsis sp. NPDC054798]